LAARRAELINCIDRYERGARRAVRFIRPRSGPRRDHRLHPQEGLGVRDIRKKIKQVNQASDELQSRLGRSRRKRELAEYMGITGAELAKIRADEVNSNVSPLRKRSTRPA
jgi:DNA-directed RNA polymerase specialized sigma subunit